MLQEIKFGLLLFLVLQRIIIISTFLPLNRLKIKTHFGEILVCYMDDSYINISLISVQTETDLRHV